MRTINQRTADLDKRTMQEILRATNAGGAVRFLGQNVRKVAWLNSIDRLEARKMIRWSNREMGWVAK